MKQTFFCYLLLSPIFLFLNCKVSSKKISAENQYIPTIISKDTSGLWVSDGNLLSDTVVLVSQGGPRPVLKFQEIGRTNWRYMPRYKNMHIAYVHQAQSYNKEIYNFKSDFTESMAAKEIDNTSEILYRSIKYFKEKGKYVIVMAHSYGTFCVTHYLASRRSLADKYILAAGRIDDNLSALTSFQNGVNGEYVDGKTFVPYPDDHLKERTEEELKERKVAQVLKGIIGKPRYSELLKNKDLTNVIYFYATNDERVGSLTDKEINFLTSKNVKVIKTHTGHGKQIFRIVDALMAGEINY